MSWEYNNGDMTPTTVSPDLRDETFCPHCRTRVKHVLKDHTPGECIAEQVHQAEQRLRATYDKRQRILARGLACALMAMAAGRRPPPGALVELLQEWGDGLK